MRYEYDQTNDDIQLRILTVITKEQSTLMDSLDSVHATTLLLLGNFKFL